MNELPQVTTFSNTTDYIKGITSYIHTQTQELSVKQTVAYLDDIGEQLLENTGNLFREKLSKEQRSKHYYFETYIGLPTSGKGTVITEVSNVMTNNAGVDKNLLHYKQAYKDKAVSKTGTGGIARKPKGEYEDIFVGLDEIMTRLGEQNIYYRSSFLNACIILDYLRLMSDKDATLIIGDTYPFTLQQVEDFYTTIRTVGLHYTHSVFYINRLDSDKNHTLRAHKQDLATAFRKMSDQLEPSLAKQFTREEFLNIQKAKSVNEIEALVHEDLTLTYEKGFLKRQAELNRADDTLDVFAIRLHKYYKALSDLFSLELPFVFISNDSSPQESANQVLEHYQSLNLGN